MFFELHAKIKKKKNPEVYNSQLLKTKPGQ